MKFKNKMTKIFQSQFPELVEKIESEVYIFLEEMILQKGIDIHVEIDYKNAEFRDILHSIVDSIGIGLSSIGIPDSQIEFYFKKEYRFFKTQTSLKTYKNWIDEEFKEYIDFIMFNDILNYFIDPNNNLVTKMIDFALLDEDIRTEFNNIMDKYPNLSKFLSWSSNLEEQLKEHILYSDKFQSLLKFSNPVDNIQCLYSIYRILEFFNLNDSIQLSNAVEFLVGGVENWCSQDSEFDFLKKSSLLAGLYITTKADIDIDKTPCQKRLKTLLIEVLKLIQTPIFTEPYKINTIIHAMKLLGLNLTAKFIDHLVSKNDKCVQKEFLKTLSTDKLALIILLFKDLGFSIRLNEEDRKNILEILNEREISGLYSDYNDSQNSGIVPLWGALIIMIENKSLNKIDLGKFIEFIINEINQIANNLDIYDNTSLGNLRVALEIMEIVDTHYDAYLIMELEKYVFSESKISLPSLSPKKMINEYLDEAEKAENKAKSNINTSLDLDFDDKIDFDDNIDFEEIDFDEDFDNSIAEETMKVEEIFKLNNTSNDIIKFFYDIPSLPDDIIKSLKINFIPIFNPHVSIQENLENLYSFIVIEKVLRLKQYFSKDDIVSIVKNFIKNNAFGAKDSSQPDLKNTYFGLAILEIYNAIDTLNLSKIHDYLINELKFFNRYKIYENRFLFLSLKLLENYNFPIDSYKKIELDLLSSDYSNYDDYNPLLETINQVVPLKIISPENSLNDISDKFIRLLKVEMNVDGGINNTITDTSRALITLSLLNGLLKEKELSDKLSQFIIMNGDFFPVSVESNNISWGVDPLGYSIELKMLYWAVFSLAIKTPIKTTKLNLNICTKCGTYFEEAPKFCNICGNKIR